MTLPMGVKKKRRRRAMVGRSAAAEKDDPDVTVRFIKGRYSSTSTDTDSEIEHFQQHRKSKKNSSSGNGHESQVLCVLLVIAVVVIVTLTALLLVQHYVYKPSQGLCTSPDCVSVAGTMLRQMDLTVDPCTDFYEYACGYINHDPNIPPDKAKWGAFSQVNKANQAILKRLLDEPGSKYMGADSTAIAKVKQYYKTCMNIGGTEAAGKTNMYELIKKLGSWPMAPSEEAGTWNEATFDLVSSISIGHTTVGKPLFDMGVTVDDKNSSLQRILFDQGGLTFSDYTHYVGNNTQKFRNAYVKFVTSVAVLLGAENATATKDAQDMWDLEIKIANAQDKPEQRQDTRVMYHLMTVKELNDILGSSFNAKTYLNKIFPDPVENSEQVIVYAPNFFKKLVSIISDTPKRVLANYVVWQSIVQMTPYMTQEFQLVRLELKKVLQGISSPVPQWEVCVTGSSSALGFALGGLFVQNEFTADDKQQVEMILETIRSTFEGNLPNVEWMDKETQERAIDKARAMGQKIGYPEFIMDPAKLDEHYDKMIVGDSYFQNALNVNDFAIKKNVDKRGKPPDKTEWNMMPADVNAYYTPTKNEIVFPAGILRAPFYSSQFPMSVNFGAMGMVIGHELTHGFDNLGRLYDKYGNLANWWGNTSTQQYEEKTKCLVKQYSDFLVGDKHLNGITTLGENIADNGGLKTAYRAYHAWRSDDGFSEGHSNLPGLNMTDDQLFFLGFGQLWCSYYTPQYAEQSLVTDVHAYAKYRVIGPLSNMKEFSDAFQCSSTSKMNPPNKCGVW